jgi:hypothetical protein
MIVSSFSSRVFEDGQSTSDDPERERGTWNGKKFSAAVGLKFPSVSLRPKEDKATLEASAEKFRSGSFAALIHAA